MSMDASWAKSFLESSRTVWVISAVILCLFALTNLPWQLDDYDQAQQAFTSFEMIKEGHWFFSGPRMKRLRKNRRSLVGLRLRPSRSRGRGILRGGFLP